jgi:hypothetical protein
MDKVNKHKKYGIFSNRPLLNSIFLIPFVFIFIAIVEKNKKDIIIGIGFIILVILLIKLTIK